MYIHVKRIFDIIFSAFGLVILSPVFLMLYALVKLTSKGPALFKQKRIGIHKNEFFMLKFRTMRIDAPKDTPTHLLQNPYAFITPVGRFLRKTSLDELPQLFNILKGDMSIIGPRPALWNQYDLIALRDAGNANSLRPGLTGLAQISGRDELPLEIKAAYDVAYAKKISLFFDITILLKTIYCLFSSHGVQEGANE